MKNKNLKKVENNADYIGNSRVAVKRRFSLLRKAGICILFVLMLLSAMFAFGSFGKLDNGFIESEEHKAYAATNKNAENAAAWEAAIKATSTAAAPQTVTLEGNWIAVPYDSGTSDRRTEFPNTLGKLSTAYTAATTFNNMGYGWLYDSSKKTYNYSGCLYVPKNKFIILDLAGYTIDRNLIDGLGNGMFKHGCTIMVAGNLTIIDSSATKTGKITGGWDLSDEGGHAATMNTHGGGITVVSGGSLTLNGGNITGNRATNGAGVCCAGGTLVMNDGAKITDNELRPGRTAWSGSAVYSTVSTFTMNGGEISGNVARTTEAACATVAIPATGTSKNTFIMNGGTITGNKAYVGTMAVGGVMAGGTNYITAEFYGGSITNNIGRTAGGVFAATGATTTPTTLKMGGSPVIKDNYVQDDEASTEKYHYDVDLSVTRANGGVKRGDYRTAVINVVAPLEAGAHINVVKWTNNYATDYTNAITKGFDNFNPDSYPSEFFHPSMPDYSELTTVMVNGSAREASFINKVDILNWQDAVLTSSAANPLTVSLYHDIIADENGDFIVPSELTVSPNRFMFNDYTTGFANATTQRLFDVPSGKSVILDLNNHKIDRNLTDATDAIVNGFVMRANAGTLEITDTSTAKGGKITGGYDTYAGCLYIVGNGNVTLSGGSIEGNKGGSYGGAIDINGGTFTMTGGSIKNNHAYAVYNASGALTANSGMGGAIFARVATNTINLYGGEISGNTADVYGGAIYMSATTYAEAALNKLTVRGGASIINNDAGEGGGGIYFPVQRNYFALGSLTYTDSTGKTVTESPIIEGNTVNGSPNDIHLPSTSAAKADKEDNGLITIINKLTNTHKYGVYRDIGYTFTKDFKTSGSTGKPEDYFYAQKDNYYVSTDSTGEGQLISDRASDNWYSAVFMSFVMGAKNYVVKLTEDWTSVSNATSGFTSSMYGDETVDSFTAVSKPYLYGTPNVPAGANITLDLNGRTLDRGLAGGLAGTVYGSAIGVCGKLKVIDSMETGKQGVITGGWLHNNAAYYYGGGISVWADKAELTIEGGLITGNKCTGFTLDKGVPSAYYGVGGVGLCFATNKVTMLGGEISGNLGSFAGGVGMVSLVADTFKVGRDARILNNFQTTDLNADFGEGTPSDFYNPAATAGTTVAHIINAKAYKIDIAEAFTSNAKIGISRPSTNNYTLIDYNGNIFTNGFSMYNGDSLDPALVFFSSDKDFGEIRTYKNYDTGATEATYWVKDAATNWSNAVAAKKDATTGPSVEVKLYKDWIADADGRFGTGTGYGETGGLLQNQSNIILDLNGYKIDRGLSGKPLGVNAGYVIKLGGISRLEIRDSKGSGHTGLITGGSNSTEGEAGGITVTTATANLILSGGTITGNKGLAGGVATYTAANFLTGNYLEMKGDVLITGNTDMSDKPLNLNLRAKFVQEITIMGVLTNAGKTGVNKDGLSDFTVNFNTFHGGLARNLPSEYFEADLADRFVIDTAANEGALYTNDNYTNWSFAVNESVKLKDTRTVKLVKDLINVDWVADSNGYLQSNVDAGIDNATMVNGGALRVPANASIILDLCGVSINRNLTVPTADGFVIYVDPAGTLTLRDSVGGGKITGGNQLRRTDDNATAGGGVANRGKFYMEGGIITGNYASGHAQSTGGVFNDFESGVPGLFRMTGGTITENYGLFAGGVMVYNGSQVYFGGDAKVYGNKTIAGTPSDVHPRDTSTAYKISFASAFKPGARIAVAYTANNYKAIANSVFTAGYYSYNSGLNPADVFEGSDPNKYIIDSYTAAAGIEARVVCVDNEKNWREAVAASNATTQQTFQLTRDWVANPNGTYGTALGMPLNSSDVSYANGALQLPATGNIILDLNGFKLDRALTSAYPQGYVMNVLGKLEIIDSSKTKKGMITGGWSNNSAGGINFVSGSLTITGGTITGNQGTVGGLHINEAKAAVLPFAMGDSAVITGNTDVYFKESDIVATNSVQMINIISPLTGVAKGKTGFRRDGVGDFTIGFHDQMPAENPKNYFTSADPMYVFEYDNGEAALYTNNNQLNWTYAVMASQAGGKKQITFKLLDNWYAEAGEFGSGTGYHDNAGADFKGMLYVPSNANIVLDLNGFTLDRGISAASLLGCVMRVDGILTIRDTSEHQTGVITGGNNSYAGTEEAAQSSAIWLQGAATLNIEGGTIKNNRATGPQSSAITTDNASTVVKMTGGTITGNYGGPINAHTGAGAFNLRFTKTLKLGGTPKIYDNIHNYGEYSSDVHFNAVNLYIEIVAPFKTGAHIGVSPSAQVNNYAAANVGGVQFTTNYSAYHIDGDDPELYFFGSWYQAHKVVTKTTATGKEGAFWCMENYTNWINAVNASSTTNTVTFQLTENWTAQPYSGYKNEIYTKSFHPSDNTCYLNGAIFLPAGKSIILDLAGYTIDRDLYDGDAIDNGYTMYVNGALEIIDSVRGNRGKISGANNKSGGGGIVVEKGTVTIKGGNVTYNKGIQGAGVYVMDAGHLKLGSTVRSSAEIYGNVNMAGEPSNVYINKKTETIAIVSELTNGHVIGVDRPANGNVTTDFQTWMTGNDPLEYFVSENPKFYGIEGGDGELFFLSPQNDINWQYAVEQSSTTGKWQTVRLTDHWTASDDATFTTSFGSTSGYSNGALYVPAKAKIVLDLNGFTIDRNLKVERRYGSVFTVLGQLKIIDTSDKGAGLITGGAVDTYDTYFRAGGISIGAGGSVEMLGGTISGNKNSASNGAGGVYVGGTFILKDAAVVNNQSSISGVYVDSGTIFQVGGAAVVENNKSAAGVQKDVVFKSYTGVMSVVNPLTAGAHIGVYRVVNNYHANSMGGSKVSNDYSRYNSQPASTFFFASDSTHGIIDYTSGSVTEAALFCYDNALNWYNAAVYSIGEKKEVTVKMYGDWTAARVNENTSFGTDKDNYAFYNGALRVRSTAQIILDLNSAVINRDLPRGNASGYVILVEGSLKIIDTSTTGASQITGGWTTLSNGNNPTSISEIAIGSGIHVSSKGKLSLEGGSVTGNTGVGVYLAGSNTFSLGGRTKIIGNKFYGATAENNLYLNDAAQMINIVSEFGPSAKFGVMRAKSATSFGAGVLTYNYSKYNKTVEPTEYFSSDDTRYMVINDGFFDDSTMEAAFLGKDNFTNWAYAVQSSLANGGRPSVCTLYEDWYADEVTKSFGSIANAFYKGGLYVPDNCHVILDLNGFTIDRGLTAPIKDGEVIYIRGVNSTLVIRDSSDKQTGTIKGGYTDGNSSSNENGRAGGISVYNGTLIIEGGTITGNRANNYAGGVYLNGGAKFFMYGGKITGNQGKVIGGMEIVGTASVHFGSVAYVYDNKLTDNFGNATDTQSNVYIVNASNSLYVNDNIKDGAKIGVSVNVAHVPAVGRLISSGWSTYNNEFDSSKVFVTDDADKYVIDDYIADGIHEARMTLRDNKQSWLNAVKTSVANKDVQTFILYSDWDATTTSYSFGSDKSAYINGALYVPSGAKIILDLYGHTINRGLADRLSSTSNGYVIRVDGQLTIIDSTAHLDKDGNIVQGKISGGYNTKYAGGILVQKGLLTVEGGLITNNHTTECGGGIGLISGKLALGGTAQFSNNTVSKKRREDISFDYYTRNYGWQDYWLVVGQSNITITSQMVAGADESLNDIYVRRSKRAEFTTDWGKYNPHTRPDTRFKAAVSSYRVSYSGAGSYREAILLSNNHTDNWTYAVKASIKSGEAEPFMLFEDWTAANYAGGSYTTRFGTESTSYRNGALLVPAGANIVLDLAGFKLDRNHGVGNDGKYPTQNVAIIVEGTLQIVDSSITKQGEIRGGSYGILVNKATASVTLGGLIKPADLVLKGDETNMYSPYYGGTVTGNSIYGIYVNNGSFTTTSGKVTGNTLADVFVGKNTGTTINVGDDAYIYTENKTSGVSLRLESSLGMINIISKLSDDARIGYSRQSVGQLTNGWGLMNGNDTDPYEKIFISEEPVIYSKKTELVGDYNELFVSSYDNSANWQYIVDKSLVTGETQEFSMYNCWTAADDETYKTSFGSGSAFRNGALYVPEGAKVVLNLNGHKLSRNLSEAVQNGMVVYVDGELEIINVNRDNPVGLTPPTCCDRTGGVMTGGNNSTGSSGGAVYVSENGFVTITSGTISNNKATSQSASAGAVFVAGKLMMSGGALSYNSGTYAGGIYVASSGTLIMNGGSIDHSSSVSGGGAVYTTGTVEMNGGSMNDNTGVIGGIYVASGGKVTMTDGAITSNKASSAGAVFVTNATNTFFTMKGGEISGNEAVSAGGIYSAGEVKILGGTIKNNHATGTTLNDGGGAIYVAGTANVTITGGEITGNEGENGIRVHAAGILGVGGSARIYNNIAIDKTNPTGEGDVEPNDYCDILFTAKSRKLNVVSEFTSDAKIGIYRRGAGVFTIGYGLYNDANPNTVFVSNRSIYAVSKTSDDDITNIEASIGTPVDPEPAILTTPNVYNGNWQTIVKNINETQVEIVHLEAGMRKGTADGYTTIEAVNAGSYTIGFSLKDGYCWKNGTTDELILHATLEAKVVKLVWSKEVHKDADGNDIKDILGNPVCVYDGETVHGAVVVVADESLVTNVITGEKDTCTVTVSGSTKFASDGDGHTAKATDLSNSNYKLGTGDTEFKFVVEKAERPDFKVTSTQTFYNTATKMQVSGNEENGKLHFFVEDAYKSIASIDELTGELTVTVLGAKVKIKVIADETDNYKSATTISDEIECVIGELKATIAPAEVTYGDTVALSLAGSFNPDEIGTVSYSVIIDEDSTGNARLNTDGKFEALSVGTVKAIAHVGQSDYYLETTIETIITIVPRIITLDWEDTLKVSYNGSAQTLKVPAYEGVLPIDKTKVKIEVVKAGFKDWNITKDAATWTEVGKYDVGVIISDPNYALATEEDYFPIFEIAKAEPDLKFTTTVAYYTVPFKPEVTGAPEGTTPQIDLVYNTLGPKRDQYTLDRKTGIYTPLAIGTMTFEASVPETKNTEAKTIRAIFQIIQAKMPLEISPNVMHYGDSETEITASYKDTNGNSIPVTDATFELSDAYSDIAEFSIIDGKPYIKPKKAGTIKLTVHHPGTETFVKTDVDLEIVIKPREVEVTWGTTDGYIYNGSVQTPTATIKAGTVFIGSDSVAISGYETYQKNAEGELVKVSAINAGDYIIKAIMDNPNYAMDEESQIEFTIKPLPVVLTWSNTTLTYNGEEQAPTAGVTNLVGTDKCDVTVIGGKDAGTSLSATASELSNSNYTLEGGTNVTWKFIIKPLAVTVEWGETDLEYTGVMQAPEATAVGLIGDDECSVVVGGGEVNVNPKDSPYTAEATGLTNPNYTLDGKKFRTSFNILPIDPTVTLKQTEVFYGDAFTLELEGNSGGGTITFSLGEGAANATLGAGNWFTAKNVGTVEIIAEIAASMNYNAYTVTTVVTIKPRPIAVEWSDTEYTYDGESHNATAVVKNAVFGDLVGVTLSDAKTNAGTYTVSVKSITILDEKTNLYTIEGGTDVETELVINKRVVTIVWSNTEFTYDGEEHAPTATLGNFVGDDTCTATVSGQKDAGMRILAEITELSNDNYTAEGAENATVRFDIAKRLAKLAWTNTELPYTGAEQLPTATVSNLVEGDECTVVLTGAAAEVGTHIATATGLTGEDSANYTLSFDPDEEDEDKKTKVECEFEIVKADLEIALATNEVVFGTDLMLALESNPTGNDATFTVVTGGTGDAEIVDETLTPTKAGTVKVRVQVDESETYNSVDEVIEVTINKLPVVITWEYDDYVYNKTEQKPTATVANEVSGYPCTVLTVTGSVNAGENLKAEVTAISDTDNYTLEGGTDVTASYAIQPRPVTMIAWEADRSYPYTGESQGPKVTLSGILPGDECEAVIFGLKRNAGNYTAEITGLTNPNYSLDGIVDLTADFEITISKPTLTIKTTEIEIGTTEKIEVEGNIGKGNLTFTIIEGEDYGEIVGDKLRGKMLGTVKIKVKVDATANTEEAEVEGEINIIKGEAPLKLERTTVMYGSTLTLTMDDDRGNLRLDDGTLMYGNVKFTVAPQFVDNATIEGNVLKPKTAGTIRIWMETKETDYFDATKTSVEIEISKRVVNLAWTDGTYTYNGKEQAPEVKVTNLVGDDECELTVVGAKNVGDHTAKVTGLSNMNYTLDRASNLEKDFHINPYELTLTWGDLSIPYNGEDQTPKAIIEPLGEDKCEVILVVEGEHKNVNEYTVKTNGVSNSNYVLDKEYETNYHIVPADLNPKLDPAQVVYKTTEILDLLGNIDKASYTLEVMKHDSVGLGTLELNKDGKYEFTATRVGIVKIKVHVDGTANCNAYDGTLELEVIKADREVELISKVGVYGENLVLELSGNDDDPGRVIYTVADSVLAEVTGNILTPKHAGNVTLTVLIESTASYNVVRMTVQVTIKPRIVSIHWKNSEFIYNGEEQTPEAEIDNLLPGDKCDIVVGGGKVNAGTYTDAHVVSVSNPDYTIEGSISAAGHVFTIGKASIDIDLETTRVNLGEETELKVKGNDGKAPITFSVSNATGKATLKDGKIIVPEEKGSVLVTVTVAESDNYLGDTKTKLVIIDKSQLKLTLKKDTVQYGTDLALDVDGNTENKEVVYTIVDADGSAKLIGGSTLRPVKAGKVTVVASIGATESDSFAPTTAYFEVTITPIEVELIWHNFEFTYDGINLYAPKATIRGGLIGDDECEVTVKGKQLEVGNYAEGTAYADDDSLSNKNYSLGGKVVKAPSFVINRANPVIAFATTAVTINVPTEIKITGNMEFGTMAFQVGVVTDPELQTKLGEATLEGNVLTGTKLGYVHVLVTVMPTKNYNGGTAEYDILVEKAAARVDITDKTVIYGDTLKLVVTNEDKEEGFSYELVADATGTGSYTLAGDATTGYTLTATGAGEVYVYIDTEETETYKATHKKITITILPVVLEVTWSIGDYEYDGTEQAPTPIIKNRVGSDVINMTVSGAVYASKEATAAITALDNPNYTLEGATTASTTFEIKPRKVVLTWTYPELTYNGKEQTPEATVSNVVSTADGLDHVSVTVNGVKDAGVGLTATAIAVSNTNYTLEGVTGVTTTYEIKPYAVGIEWGELRLEYTGHVNVPTASALDTFDGDIVEVTVVGVGVDSGDCVHASSSPYQATATGVNNTNYTLKDPDTAVATRSAVRRMAASAAGSLTTDYYIVPATVEFDSSDLLLIKEYNGMPQDPTIHLLLLNKDDKLTLEYTNGKQTDAGTYKVGLSLSGASSSDYVLADSDLEKDFTITPKTINVYVRTKDATAEYTGEAVKLTDWYTLSTSDFIGDDVGKSVEEVFTTNTLKIAPLFEQGDKQFSSVGARGSYTLLADLDNVTGELSGGNYKAKLVLDTTSVGTLTIEGGEGLKLALETNYKFLVLEEEEEDGEIFLYRKTYDDKGWTHGKDDTKLDRVVLGNILPETSVGEFILNIDPAQLNKIRIYNNEGELIFDCGSAADGIYEEDLYDSSEYSIGTGWVLKYGKDEEAADVVYLSVLGDVNGDGYVNGNDIFAIGRYIRHIDDFSNDEIMLAAMLDNYYGCVSAKDITIICNIRNHKTTIDKYM